jgi:hypothetical protein
MEMRKTTALLWPTKVAFYEMLDAEARMAEIATAAEYTPSDGLKSASERRVRGIMDQFPELLGHIRDCVSDYLEGWGHLLDSDYCENRALLIGDRAHINTHADNREGDVTAVLFLTGRGVGQPINSVGNPRFVLEDPSRFADQARLPFEARPGFSVNPRPGLLVVFPSHIPHNQHPYEGDTTHVQVVLNFRLNIPEDLQEELFD